MLHKQQEVFLSQNILPAIAKKVEIGTLLSFRQIILSINVPTRQRSLCLFSIPSMATCAANCSSHSSAMSPVITGPSGDRNHVAPSKGFKQNI